MTEAQTSPTSPSALPAPVAAPPERHPAFGRQGGIVLPLILAAVTVVFFGLTIVAMAGRLGPLVRPNMVLGLLLLDLVLLLALSFLVLRRVLVLWLYHKKLGVGAKLHVQFLLMFGLVAAMPTIVISVFSILVVVLGLQEWLGTRVRDALSSSLVVGEAYLQEHRVSTAEDARFLGEVLRGAVDSGLTSSEALQRIMGLQAASRRLSEAVLFSVEDGEGGREFSVLARAPGPREEGEGLRQTDVKREVSLWALNQAELGRSVFPLTPDGERVRALRYLGSDVSRGEGDPPLRFYLLVSRDVSAEILGYIEETSSAVSLYTELEGQRSNFIVRFAAVFVGLSGLLFLSAAWVGIAFANRLSLPLSSLIRAADRMRRGDLSARAGDAQVPGELAVVLETFDRMGGSIAEQQRALLEANRELAERRAFIEATLTGVSSGVVALDADGRVQMMNARARHFFPIPESQLLGRRLGAFSRELRVLLERARLEPARLHTAQVQFPDPERGEALLRTFQVRLAVRDTTGAPAGATAEPTPAPTNNDTPAEKTALTNNDTPAPPTSAPAGAGAEKTGTPALASTNEVSITGFVITFEDLTESLAAQRKAAWSDVARRIAHEIKNPLTPIQLSAERLERRVADSMRKHPTEDTNADADADSRQEAVQSLVRASVRTITGQVEEIRRLVDEFSDFARMPEPMVRPVRLERLLADVVDLVQSELGTEMAVETSGLEAEAWVMGDAGQLRRAVLNLIRNAGLSLDERRARGAEEDLAGAWSPRLAVRLEACDTSCSVMVEDNGVGLPAVAQSRLLEPYFTTRLEGSGLGLAIVQKISEDHDGSFALRDAPTGGVVAEIRVPALSSGAAALFDGRDDTTSDNTASDHTTSDDKQGKQEEQGEQDNGS